MKTVELVPSVIEASLIELCPNADWHVGRRQVERGRRRRPSSAGPTACCPSSPT